MEHGGTVVTLEGRAAGSLLPRLLPLLDGTRTVDDLFAELGPKVAPAIENALVLLDANRLLVDGKGDEEVPAEVAAAAAFAATVTSRTSERAAATAIAESSVSVAGTSASAKAVRRVLDAMGFGPVAALELHDEPRHGSFLVAAPAESELQGLRVVNERALARRTAWLQVLPFDGRVAVVGPLYLPGQSACHRCYVLRRGACSGYEDDFDLIERELPRVASPAALTSVLAGLAALIVLRWVTTTDPTLPGRLYALDLGQVVRLAHEYVLRVPRCPVCGPVDRAVPSPWFEEST